MKLSIIIPSYNMESKIKQCLDSILNQDADKAEYEIIIFDSSNDGSEIILKDYTIKYQNLKVIKAKNKTGCGTARNVAVKYATGEYVYCVDIDDKLFDGALPKILDKLNGTIDIYFCPYRTLKTNQDIFLKPKTITEFACTCPVGTLAKLYKRSLYVQQPNYMPEDVVPHYLLVDKCENVSYFDFLVYEYDNRNEHLSGISRTFDFLKTHPSNLITLAANNILTKNNLRDEYITGVIKNLADMYEVRNSFKNQDVKNAFMQRFYHTYQNFMSGIYIH